MGDGAGDEVSDVIGLSGEVSTPNPESSAEGSQLAESPLDCGGEMSHRVDGE